MDTELFAKILSFDSTSGQEHSLGQWLASNLVAEKVEVHEFGEASMNVFLNWGKPKIVFCSHMDTVPPYIAPTFGQEAVMGRGTCDAKGQIFAMYSACKELSRRGKTDFGLLILSGEETGSWGAKEFAKTAFKAPLLVVGEPTDNCMVSASKGTKSFELTFTGKAFHSGYPEMGRSAVEMFVDFVDKLRAFEYPQDPILGQTTYNIGMLNSENPQNILSPSLSCRLYFRTTFASDNLVSKWVKSQASDELTVISHGGDAPARYHTMPGFKTKVVAFGSDAPHLNNFEKKIICGPGSITVAHRDDEFISFADLQEATDNYIKIYEGSY